ncbi:MAG: hypothetical protein ACYCPD_09775 [Acidobacteriaceae bacterium]
MKSLRILICGLALCERYGNGQTAEDECDGDTQLERIDLHDGNLTAGQPSMSRLPRFTCVYGAAMGRSFNEGIGSGYDEISGLDRAVPKWNAGESAAIFFVAAI